MKDMTLNKAQTIIVLSPLNDVHGSNEGKIQFLSSSSLNTGLSGFNLADFIAPEIATYLGVRSLVRFGATSKYNFAVMTDEIYCRKKCVADIENVEVDYSKDKNMLQYIREKETGKKSSSQVTWLQCHGWIRSIKLLIN